MLLISTPPSPLTRSRMCGAHASLPKTGSSYAVPGDFRERIATPWTFSVNTSRPAIAEYLGLEGEVGLTTVLIGKADIQDAMQPWGTAAFTYCPRGIHAAYFAQIRGPVRGHRMTAAKVGRERSGQHVAGLLAFQLGVCPGWVVYANVYT